MKLKWMVCQYPKSDNIHFYVESDISRLKKLYGVNTLNRITFISTKEVPLWILVI